MWTLFVGTAIVVCFLPSSWQGNPPHVIFIVADDLGWNDVGWHNPDILTPNLDRYARKGVILNDSYVQPICSPSRNSFMTGLYPYHTGLQHEVIHPAAPMYVPQHVTFLPQRLKTAGYKTHIVGKWHLGFCNWKYTPTYRGFDTFFGYLLGAEDYYKHTRENGFDFRFNTDVYHGGDGVYSTELLTRHAEEIIRSHDQSKPLYLYLPYQAVHGPLQVPKRFEHLYSNVQDYHRRLYSGMVSALDEAFGNVTQALEDSGIDNNMLLVFTTDNGGATHSGGNNWPLRGAKGTVWEGGTRGPAFVYSKNLLHKTGYTNTEMIHAVDWFPTILELAGVHPEPGIDGVSQVKTLTRGTASARTEFVYNINEVNGKSAIRMGNFKLVKGAGGGNDDWYPPPEIHGSSNHSLPTHNAALPAYMLFNIKQDPTEHHDLSQKHPDTLQRLKQRLDHWMTSLVPAQHPHNDARANPSHFGGNWSPGWC